MHGGLQTESPHFKDVPNSLYQDKPAGGHQRTRGSLEPTPRMMSSSYRNHPLNSGQGPGKSFVPTSSSMALQKVVQDAKRL